MTKNLRVFTIDEANRLIPQLVPLLDEMRSLRADVDRLEVEIDAAELIAPKEPNEGERVRGELGRLSEELKTKSERLSERVAFIQELGCFLKSIELGVIDFLSERDGRQIFLCWQLGEPYIQHWHEIGQGFSSRQSMENGR